jgi:hypothetical protein
MGDLPTEAYLAIPDPVNSDFTLRSSTCTVVDAQCSRESSPKKPYDSNSQK